MAIASAQGGTVRLDALARELAAHIRAAEGADGGGGDGRRGDGDDVAARMRAGLPALLDACLDDAGTSGECGP